MDGPEVALALDVLPQVVQLVRQAAAAAPDGLGPTQFRILRRLASGQWRCGQLATDLDVTPPTVSAAVDGLVRRRLVERQSPGPDRRAVPLAATEAGRRALAAAERRQAEALGAVLSGMPPAQRRALAVGLGGLAEALRRLPVAAEPARA